MLGDCDAWSVVSRQDGRTASGCRHSPRPATLQPAHGPHTCTASATAATAWCAAAACGDTSGCWLARPSNGGSRAARCGWMAAPATSASAPSARRLVEETGGLMRRGTMTDSSCGRTPSTTRRPSSAWRGARGGAGLEAAAVGRASRVEYQACPDPRWDGTSGMRCGNNRRDAQSTPAHLRRVRLRVQAPQQRGDDTVHGAAAAAPEQHVEDAARGGAHARVLVAQRALPGVQAAER